MSPSSAVMAKRNGREANSQVKQLPFARASTRNCNEMDTFIILRCMYMYPAPVRCRWAMTPLDLSSRTRRRRQSKRDRRPIADTLNSNLHMQTRLDGGRPGAIAELCECVGQWFRCSTAHAGGGRGNAMNPPARVHLDRGRASRRENDFGGR
ncbi:hypothetical protein F442_16950 [Phytophthora nicotianae P10297]|nr:hypothetical protein L914_16451 [Phytophthora nicotianae]ETP34812.1 hypothetical protein F442_16950 [Phytophthora nicotianae P10297]